MNNTTKQQALDKIKQLQEEMKKLEQIVNAPEEVGSLLYKNARNSYEPDYSISWSASTGLFHTFNVDKCMRNPPKASTTFQSQELTDNYAKAFNTFLALRHCEGSEPAVDKKEQWCIRVDCFSLKPDVCVYGMEYAKITELSPMFSSEEYARAAIDCVGEKNIIHMFKTFHHVE